MQDINYFKAVQTDSAKLAAREKITAVYPIEKQLNILRLAPGFTQSDLNAMSAFIDDIRSQCSEIEAQIAESGDLEWIASLDIRF